MCENTKKPSTSVCSVDPKTLGTRNYFYNNPIVFNKPFFLFRKTGISSATQLAKLVPKGPKSEKEPDIEWWDQVILGLSFYYRIISVAFNGF